MTRKVVGCISLLFVVALASTNIAGVTAFSGKPASKTPAGSSASSAQKTKEILAEIEELDREKGEN